MVRKGIISVLFTCFMLFSVIGFASPASDALAQEEILARPVIQAIVNGEKDFSRFAKSVDKNFISNVSILAKASENGKEIADVKSFDLAGFRRDGAFDYLVYVGETPGQDIVIFNLCFNSQTSLLAGLRIDKAEKQTTTAR